MANKEKSEISRKKFLEISDRLKELPLRKPQVGDCFFLEAPTLYPLEEQDCVLVAAIRESKGALTVLPISLEYWEASQYDYLLDPTEWHGGYPAIVEAWNPLLVLPENPLRIHATLPPDILEKLRILFRYHQRGENPPPNTEGIGRPLSTEDDPRWEFRTREAALVERARRYLQEGWSAKILLFPKSRIQAKAKKSAPMRVAAKEDSSLETMARKMVDAFDQATKDQAILETERGVLLLRYLPKQRIELYWHSEGGYGAPQVEAQPAMKAPPKEVPSMPIETLLGFWPDEPDLEEIKLNVLEGGRIVSFRVVIS